MGNTSTNKPATVLCGFELHSGTIVAQLRQKADETGRSNPLTLKQLANEYIRDDLAIVLTQFSLSLSLSLCLCECVCIESEKMTILLVSVNFTQFYSMIFDAYIYI